MRRAVGLGGLRHVRWSWPRAPAGQPARGSPSSASGVPPRCWRPKPADGPRRNADGARGTVYVGGGCGATGAAARGSAGTGPGPGPSARRSGTPLRRERARFAGISCFGYPLMARKPQPLTQTRSSGLSAPPRRRGNRCAFTGHPLGLLRLPVVTSTWPADLLAPARYTRSGRRCSRQQDAGS